MILLDNDDVLILVDDNDVLIMLDDDDVLILVDNDGVLIMLDDVYFFSTRFYHEIQSWPDCDPSNSHWFKNKQDNTWVGVRSVVGRFLRKKYNPTHQVRVGHCLVSQPAGSQRFSRRRKSTFCSRIQGRCLGEAEGRPPHGTRFNTK